MGNCKHVRVIARGNKVCGRYVLESHVHCLWLALQTYSVWHMVSLLRSYSQALTPIFSLCRDAFFRRTVLGNSTSWLVEHHKDTIFRRIVRMSLSAESHVLGWWAPDHIGMWSAGEAPAISSRVAEERTFKEDFPRLGLFSPRLWFCFWSWRCTPLDGFILYYTSQWYPWDSCAHYLLKAPRAYRHENVKHIQTFVGRIKFLWTLLLDMWRILCMPPFPLPRKVIHLPFGACTPTQI